MFHSLDGVSIQEQAAANVRQFVGDGTPYLKCPGLKDAKAVRLGRSVLPQTIEQEFPTDNTLTRLEKVTSPLWILQFQADGTPVLLRSMQSNDGVWQQGVPVFVQGQWEGYPEPEQANSSEQPDAAAAEAAAKAQAEADAKAAAEAAGKK